MEENEIDKLIPNAAPGGETPVSDNPVFVSACMARISEDAKQVGWRFGNSILTHSDTWGFVFRIDLHSEHDTPKSKWITRYIYWSGETHDQIIGAALVNCENVDPL
jgi:hypothetical protein